MTSHQDVAVVVARLRTVEYFSDGLMAARTESDADLIDRLRAERKEAASLLESQAKALSEWKQAASVEAGLRREFYDRALAAEALLAEASRLLVLYGHPDAARAFTNAAKEKT